MRYSYSSSFENFKRAQRTYVRSSTPRRIYFHLLMWGLSTIGLLVFATLAVTGVLNQTIGLILAPVAAGLMAGGVVCPIIRPWQTRKIYKNFCGPINTPTHVYLETVDGTLVSGIEGKSEGRFQRSAICETAEDEAMLLLFVAKKRFLYLPKASLPPEALNEVRAWLQLPGAPEKC